MNIVYIGNFSPPHSTENEILKALRDLGHVVAPYQENDPATWRTLADMWTPPDFVLWTRTWELDHDMQYRALLNLSRRSIPVVGYHLDRWWGLKREGQVATQPFFRCDLVCTADGGHDAEWAEAGVEHAWFPPAVSRFECEPGTPRDEFRADIAFVGSWNGYHPEWGHRADLVRFLQRRGARMFPAAGEPSIRGEALRDLYASVKVVVGDSCLVPNADGTPVERYWSDRVPETLGRGGFLIHPWVAGIDREFPLLSTWELGDFDDLAGLIDHALASEDELAVNREAHRAWVVEHHTYSVRMKQLETLLRDRGML